MQLRLDLINLLSQEFDLLVQVAVHRAILVLQLLPQLVDRLLGFVQLSLDFRRDVLDGHFVDIDSRSDVLCLLPEQQSVDSFVVVLVCLAHGADDSRLAVTA